MSELGLHPPAMWAQRSDIIYLTFNLECKDPEIRFEKQSLYFKGIGLPENKLYEAKIPLYDEIIPEECTKHNKGRCIQVILSKSNKKAPFWPSFTNEKKKLHWLKVDFSKMQDENESGGEEFDPKGPNSLEEMMRSMGGLDDNPDKPTFDDLASDSDDEDLPDLI